MIKDSVWDTPGLYEEFKILEEQGLPHPEVARRLNTKYQTSITANACIGKVHRDNIKRPNSRQYPPVNWDTPGLVEDFKELHAMGIIFPTMARVLTDKYKHLNIQVTTKAIRTKARRLGLAKRTTNTEGVKRRREKQKASGWNFGSFYTRAAPQDAAGRLEYRRKVNSGEITPRKAKGIGTTEDDYTPVEMRKSLLDLTDDQGRDLHLCKWPYGDGPFTFCGRPSSDTYPSYCSYHAYVHFHGAWNAQRFYCQAAE